MGWAGGSLHLHDTGAKTAEIAAAPDRKAVEDLPARARIHGVANRPALSNDS
jgi:hypothetical protein